MTPDELTAINHVARTTGNDTVFDALLLRLHTETACRRGGALGLRLQDLDADRGPLLLRDKGGTTRWQPISRDLANGLVDHTQARGAVLPTDPLLRYRTGTPLTSRRYDQLWRRIGRHLPWGSPPTASPPTGCATPPSPGSNATSVSRPSIRVAGAAPSAGRSTVRSRISRDEPFGSTSRLLGRPGRARSLGSQWYRTEVPVTVSFGRAPGTAP